MNVLSLFSGIGGIDLGLERAGMTVVGQVEIDPWCRRVLAKHWPEVPRHDDVRTCAEWWLGEDVADADSAGRGERRRPEPVQAEQRTAKCRSQDLTAAARAGTARPAVDVVAGGFPCQPVSVAGKGRAQADQRWLWPAFAATVRRLRPRYVLVENVPGLLARGMGDVVGDLAACGYDTEWDCIPASAVGAPHRRDRVWIVAYAADMLRHGSDDHARVGVGSGQVPEPRNGGRTVTLADAERLGRARLTDAATRDDPHWARARREQATGRATSGRQTLAWARPAGDAHWTVEPDVGRVAHGIPARVDRLRGLGNAVVPQVVEHIGRLILAHAERAA